MAAPSLARRRPTGRPLREAIERAVPVSAGASNRTVSRDHTRERLEQLTGLAEQTGFDPGSYAGKWELQLGTLGSGNTPQS